MNVETWLVFCLAEFLLCLSPGPAVIYVASQGLGAGFKSSLSANAGIVTGNTLYFIISATGLGALIVASHTIFSLIKWGGAAYLIYLGAKYFFSHTTALQLESVTRMSLGKVYRTGMLIQLSNPKNLVFFIAILPQFINPDASIAMQVLILGISSQVIEVLVLLFYGASSSRLEAWVKEKGLASTMDKISGGALISIGASLVFFQR